MRFMVIRKADSETEAAMMPSEELVVAMTRYNEALIDAGIMKAGDGLKPSAEGARVKFSAGRPSVTDGPFTETKELVAGYTIIDVKNREEALAWSKRFPNPSIDAGEAEIEVREFIPMEHFGDSPAVQRAKNLKLGE